MDRALMHCDCVYRFPALRAQGNVCRTNLPSHTAFRGFGGPQVSGRAGSKSTLSLCCKAGL